MRARGRLGLEEMLFTLARLFRDPRWRAERPVLLDHSEASGAVLRADHTQQLAELLSMLRSRIGRSRLAVVAPDDAAFGTARMWQAQATDWDGEIAVFRDQDLARGWLVGVAHAAAR